MDEALFSKLIEKLEKLSSSLEKLINDKDKSLTKDQKEDIKGAVADAINETRSSTRVQGNEKTRIQKIAKIYKNEFKDLFENLSPAQDAAGNLQNKVEVTLDRKTFRGIEQTLRKVLPDFAEMIKKSSKDIAAKKGGIFSFLGDIIGGAFGFLGSFSKLLPLILSVGGIALAFYIVKNIEKIARSIDTVLRSGKENLPDILKALKENLFPFWDDFTDTASYFFDRTLDTIDTLIKQLPVLFDILLSKLPMIRAEVVGFLNDMNDLGKKLSQNSFIQNLAFLFSLSLPAGLIAAIIAITKPLRVLNAVATAALVTSLGYYFGSFKELEKVSWETIAKAAAALGGLFGVLFFTAKGLPGASNVASLLAVGGAAAGTVLFLKEIGMVLKEWDGINWEDLAKAGVTITGLFAAIAAAGAIGTAGAIPALIALGVGLAAAGSAMLAIRGLGESLKPVMGTFQELRQLFEDYTKIDAGKLTAVAGGVTALAGALTLQTVTGGANAITGAFTNVWSFITGQKSPIDKLKEFEALDGEKLDRNAQAIKTLFQALETGGTDGIKRAIKNLNDFRPIKETSTATTNAIRPAQNRVANDFIVRPNQPPIMFSSDDNILSFKNVSIFNPIKDQIAESYKNVETMFNKLLEQSKKGSFESTSEVKRQTDILQQIAQLNKQMTEEGNNVSMVNTNVTNKFMNIDSHTSSSFRNRAGTGISIYA